MAHKCFVTTRKKLKSDTELKLQHENSLCKTVPTADARLMSAVTKTRLIATFTLTCGSRGRKSVLVNEVQTGNVTCVSGEVVFL